MNANHGGTFTRCPGQDDTRFAQVLPEFLLNRSNLSKPDYDVFSKPWIERSRKAADQEEWMEAFIYLWITFNAWIAIVVADTRYEDDGYLWRAAGLDSQLSARFDRLKTTDKGFHDKVEEFQELWPIFKVRTLVDKGVESWGAWGRNESRGAYRITCFQHDLERTDYSPRCYAEHQTNDVRADGGSPSNVPADWGHTLSAIYQVRCNLFHGGKSFVDTKDKNFTRLAYSILFNVWKAEIDTR